MSLNFYTEEEDNKKERSINNYKSLFINYEKKLPTLPESLKQMFKSENLNENKINELTNDILEKCKMTINNNYNKIKIKYNKITKVDAYIICVYTCESKDRKYSPYRILNQNLVSNNRKKGIENISKYLYIFLNSLRKLPRYYPPNKYLYRCITHKVSLSKDPFNENLVPYIRGNKKTFWGFTSTSGNPKTIYSFLKEEEKMKTGTIFSLEGDIWGYDIELFNYFGEKEILLEPERIFLIDNVLPPVNDIIYVTCKILKTPLVLSNNEIVQSIITNNKINNIGYDNNINYPKNFLNYSDINKYIIKIETEIKINENYKFISGIGLLCNISSKNIKVLITYNHLINFELLYTIKNLEILINKEEIKIDMKINRYKYTNKELDITIIEILDEDNIDNFIEVDKFINSRNYENKDIISAYLKDDQKVEILKGRINSKKNNNYTCSIDGIKEGIIILEENKKLIGIIKENNNKGQIEFIPMNIIINKINFIKCKYEIKKKDVGKYIQIVNDKDFSSNIINIEIEKEMKIIIDGEIKSNIFKYKFNKEGLKTIYLIAYNPLTNMSCMFKNCFSLKEINLSSFNTYQVTNMSSLFYGCSSLNKINWSSFSTDNVTNIYRMFYGCSSLREINLSSFKTNQVTNMSRMFFGCSSLGGINLKSFNTNRVTDMSHMFDCCSSLKELDLSSFNTDQVIDMSHMFNCCYSLKELNLYSFNTKLVNNMSWMFYGCSSLNKINLFSFNTNLVTNMSNMFYGCSSLKQIDLSSFNTNLVINMSNMFRGCYSLKDLNISSFKTNYLTNKSNMFKGCYLLNKTNLMPFYTNRVNCVII